jgi:hypothetical protein
MFSYDTLSEALKDMKNRGFTTDFNIAFLHIECSKTGKKLLPADFEIVEHYRFEGDSDPADESVIYAIQSVDGNTKGTLVSAYGTYSEEISEELIQKLAIHE